MHLRCVIHKDEGFSEGNLNVNVGQLMAFFPYSFYDLRYFIKKKKTLKISSWFTRARKKNNTSSTSTGRMLI